MQSEEEGHGERPIGYGIIASGMSADKELLIFRRFGSLNVRNLLYMQAELNHLESELQRVDNDLNGPPKVMDSWIVPRSWHEMTSSEKGREELALVVEIRQKLKEYNEALRRQAWVSSLETPTRKTWEVLRDFVQYHDEALDDDDDDRAFLRPHVHPDLVSLGGKSYDPMTCFLMRSWARVFQTEEDRQRTQGNLNFSSSSRIQGFVRIIAVIVSSLLPILSIVVLYFIHSQPIRLLTIVLFSGLCSLVLAILTDARNAEIIATTAAYAAVQVVFVSGDISS